MSTTRLLASAALGASLLMAVVAAPASASAAQPAASPAPTYPQVASAQQGAAWLAGQFTGDYIPSTTSPGEADLSATANAVLALASTGDDTTALDGLGYLEANVDSYVDDDGSDGSGQLALLILDAHALGADPDAFGGTDLVSRLLATQQMSGADTGLFGVQNPTYDGAYRQGLSLAALAAVGETSGTQVSSAERWLTGQQCPDGGWTSYVTADNPCNGSPADYVGPDTNSTALAVQGLSAQGDLAAGPAKEALKFLKKAQDRGGGWGYEPNAAHAPGSTDPDSTALVIQAILALGKSPIKGFSKGSADPVTALLSFQLTSGGGAGAFYFPGSTAPDLLATYQAVPAMAGVDVPFNLEVTTPSLPSATVGHAYATTLAASGGRPPYTWKVLGGSLPAGLELAGSSGVISGTPTTAGTSTFTVEVLDTKSTGSPPTQDTAWKVFSVTASP
ncbi:MAG: putative Ig domain-containing protein [Acidimicrobiales bacterium]